MNDQNQNSTPNSNTPPPIYRDRHEQRRAERWARREAHWQRRGHYGWFGGAIMILLGIVFLLQNMGIPFLENWWALFILIPAFWAYASAWEIYQDKGQLTRGGVGSLTTGILLTILSLFFLIDLTASPFWPVLLIVAGIVLLGTAWLPE
jgi:LiaF transmembrane domain